MALEQEVGLAGDEANPFITRSNCISLDPMYRDRIGVGDPVVRVTYDVRLSERGLRE